MTPAIRKNDRHPFASLDANSVWVDRLLQLFWTVDASVKRDEDLPSNVRAIYELAEQARQKL